METYICDRCGGYGTTLETKNVDDAKILDLICYYCMGSGWAPKGGYKKELGMDSVEAKKLAIANIMKMTDPKIEQEHECTYAPGDCDICSACGEHTEFCEECGSACCGARAYDTCYEPAERD